MANMSYCRFENTAKDIADCMEALDEHNWDIEQIWMIDFFHKKQFVESYMYNFRCSSDAFGNWDNFYIWTAASFYSGFSYITN